MLHIEERESEARILDKVRILSDRRVTYKAERVQVLGIWIYTRFSDNVSLLSNKLSNCKPVELLPPSPVWVDFFHCRSGTHKPFAHLQFEVPCGSIRPILYPGRLRCLCNRTGSSQRSSSRQAKAGCTFARTNAESARENLILATLKYA